MMTATLIRDMTGLEKLFLEHYQFVYRTAYGITGSTEDARDVLQTIFLRLLDRPQLPDLKNNAKAYLHRAAVNESLNSIQARNRRNVTNAIARVAAQAQSETNEFIERLHHRLYGAMGKLDRATADILVLRYVHDYSDAEIGRLIGKPRGVVAVRLYRARARLKTLMEQSQDEDS